MKENFSFSQPENQENQDRKKQETTEASVFSEGEVFNAQEELDYLKGYHGAEGLEKVKEFKEKLKFQKLGLMRLESILINYLEENQELDKKELLELLNPEIKKYALTTEQLEALGKTVSDFVKKSETIKKLVAPLTDEKGKVDGEKLYERIFNKKPVWQVEADVNSYSIYFKPTDNRDFCYVISGAYKKNRDLDHKDLELAATSGGMKLNNHPVKKLNGLIAIQNAELFEDKEISEEVMAHERRHVINDVLQKNFVMPDNDEIYRWYEILLKEGKIKTPEDEAAFITLARENLEIERAIKDEIFAYFKGGTRPKKISQMLLGDNTIYDYAYRYNLNQGHDFDLQYLNIVEDGLVSFAEFLKKGYSVDEVTALLLPEPLNKWPKTLAKMTDFQRNPERWQRKKENYISQRILKRDMFLKDTDKQTEN